MNKVLHLCVYFHIYTKNDEPHTFSTGYDQALQSKGLREKMIAFLSTDQRTNRSGTVFAIVDQRQKEDFSSSRPCFRAEQSLNPSTGVDTKEFSALFLQP